jgi:hypothetical protein
VENNQGFFFWFRLSDIITFLAMIVGALKYKSDRSKDLLDRQVAREAAIKQGAERHAENKSKLDVLMDFQRDQIMLNRQRDTQIGELKIQTAKLTEIALGVDRRLIMLEDR